MCWNFETNFPIPLFSQSGFTFFGNLSNYIDYCVFGQYRSHLPYIAHDSNWFGRSKFLFSTSGFKHASHKFRLIFNFVSKLVQRWAQHSGAVGVGIFRFLVDKFGFGHLWIRTKTKRWIRRNWQSSQSTRLVFITNRHTAIPTDNLHLLPESTYC